MSEDSSFFKKHPTLALILVNLVVFLLLMGLFEIGLRIATPEWLEQKMAIVKKDKEHDFRGTDRSWKTIKDSNGHIVSFEPLSYVNVAHSEYQHKVNLDEYGSRSFNAPDSGNFIPFFGDSFTFGLGVDSQETFISLLQEQFPHHRFLNLGIPGSGLMDQFHVLEYRIQQDQKFDKAVFCFFEGNDLSDIQRYVRKYQTTKTKQQNDGISDNNGPGLLQTLNKKIVHNPVIAHSYLVQFFKQKLMNLLNSSGTGAHMLPIYKVSSELPANAKLAESYKLNLRKAMLRIDSLATLHQIDVAYLLIPDKAQLLEESTRKMLAYYNLDSSQFNPMITTEIFSQVALELNVKFADVKNQMMLLPNKPEFYYIADNHFTPKGHRIYSKLVAPFLHEFLTVEDTTETGVVFTDRTQPQD